jgi:hypothetical protein
MRALFNGLGACTTAVVVLIITVTKFLYGAWIVLIFIPIMIYIFKQIRSHYDSVAAELRLPPECTGKIPEEVAEGRHIVIVPVSTPTRVVFETLKYAKVIGETVIAVNISSGDEEQEQKLQEKWKCWEPGVELVIIRSPYRLLMRPLIHFIDKKEREKGPNDYITVVIPEFETRKWWHRLLHNQAGWILRTNLILNENVIVTTVPYHLKH